MFDVNAGYIVMISGAVTVLLRFLPFIAFGKKRPEFVLYLGRVLPPSVMAMLTVYCLKSVDVLTTYRKWNVGCDNGIKISVIKFSSPCER